MSAKKARILIADDEATSRDLLAEVLRDEEYDVVTVPDGKAAVEAISETKFDVLLCDVNMPEMDGLAVLDHVRRVSPDTSVMMVTAYGTVETAVEAMRKGAHDYLAKPFVFDDILVRIANLLEYRDLSDENRALREELERQYDFHNIIGESASMQDVFALIKKVSQTNSNVLITGESGTGKELIARAIYHNSPQSKDGRFVPINCGAIPETLLESELFGHMKGSFTGAVADKKGLFVVADHGTLFLDEISSMPLSTQAKLLRVLEDKQIMPLGATEPILVETRIVAATNRDLSAHLGLGEGSFREDLFYRLNVLEIKLPPLRERKEDIPRLVDHFVKKYNDELKKNCKGVAEDTMEALLAYDWKGNIRELENVVERAMILSDGDRIILSDLPASMTGGLTAAIQMDDGTSASLKEAVRTFERYHIERVLQKHAGDKNKAAAELGISVSSLYRKLEEAESPDQANELDASRSSQ